MIIGIVIKIVLFLMKDQHSLQQMNKANQIMYTLKIKPIMTW